MEQNQIIAVKTFYAPTSTDIADQYVNKNSHTIPVIGFTVDDLDGLGDISSYTCSSSNTTLIPLDYVTNLQFAGAAPNKTLDIYPATDEYGYADMELILTDSHGCHKEYEFRIAVGNIWEGDFTFGGNETNWHVAFNWSSNNVPSNVIEAIIPTSPIGGVFPVIDANAQCEDFVIQPRATVTLNDTYRFQIFGDMLIESDVTGTGSFVDLNAAAGNVTTSGSVTVERYITSDAWHYVSSPLTGVTNKALTEDVCGTYNGNLLDYNENFTTDYDGDGDIDWFDGWEWPWYYTPNNDLLTPGNGYAYYTFSGSCGNTAEFTTTGVACLTSGDITYTVTNQDDTYAPTGFGPHHGWNMIGNPYPSGINAEDFLLANAGTIDGAVYLWDENSFTGFNLEGVDYATFNGVGATGSGAGSVIPDKYISTGQAFFVHRTVTDIGGTPITFTNAMREQENSSFFKGEEQEISKVKISIKNEQDMFNEIIVALKEDATDGRDVAYDAFKMEGNQELALYTKIETDNFTIQALPTLEDGEYKQVILGLNAGNVGEYLFNVMLIQYIPENVSVTLEDLYEGTIIDLKKVDYYTFYVDEAGRYDDRFILHFNANTAPIVQTQINNQTTLEDDIFDYNISNEFYDADGDQLTYSANISGANASWLSFDDVNNILTGTPCNNNVGIYEVEIIATDIFDASVSQIFEIEVVNTNDTPILNINTLDQTAETTYNFVYQLPENTFVDIDVDDILTITAENMPSWLFFNSETATFTGTPSNHDIDNYNITVTATDLMGASVSDNFGLQVFGTTKAGATSNTFEIYPNPTTGKIIINTDQSYELTITDALGRKIIQTSVSFNSKTIDLTNYPTGTYMFNIKLKDGNIINESIIVE